MKIKNVLQIIGFIALVSAVFQFKYGFFIALLFLGLSYIADTRDQSKIKANRFWGIATILLALLDLVLKLLNVTNYG